MIPGADSGRRGRARSGRPREWRAGDAAYAANAGERHRSALLRGGGTRSGTARNRWFIASKRRRILRRAPCGFSSVRGRSQLRGGGQTRPARAERMRWMITSSTPCRTRNSSLEFAGKRAASSRRVRRVRMLRSSFTIATFPGDSARTVSGDDRGRLNRNLRCGPHDPARGGATHDGSGPESPDRDLTRSPEVRHGNACDVRSRLSCRAAAFVRSQLEL